MNVSVSQIGILDAGLAPGCDGMIRVPEAGDTWAVEEHMGIIGSVKLVGYTLGPGVDRSG